MSDSQRGPKIVVIGGSVRPGNFTWKALNVVIEEFQDHAHVTVKAFNPIELNLPFPGIGIDSPAARQIQEAITAATAVVLATPEYHGTFSSVIKLVIENLGFPSVLKGKPVALLGVAAGRIGAIKAIEHLRGVCSHVGALVLPGSVSVAGVQSLFDAEGRCLDEVTEGQLRGLATNVMDYIHGSICPGVALEEMMRRGQVDDTAPVMAR